MKTDQLLKKSKEGFSRLSVGKSYQDSALKFLKDWLTDPKYKDYWPQLEHLITEGHWDYLLDCFYQILPFGTGGKRGEVGIGPNRINTWNIQASAQGHSQYLLKQYKDEAKKRGVVLAYDIREFFGNKFLNSQLPNPVMNLTCKQLAESAAEVYAANGIKVFIFDDFRTTPQLSFAIRHLNAVSGDMFSASHNPPEHNGKKVFDETGGQLIPPDDEALVEEVTQRVKEIKITPYAEAVKKGTIEVVGEKVDQAYIKACQKLSLGKHRDIKIVYTPLHGCGIVSIPPVLKKLGFTVHLDPATSNTSGKFENVTFNIPNPEVIQSFDAPLKYAKKIKADIILNSDPDADRIGVMVNHHGKWEFLNGNEIGAILTEYVIGKYKKKKQKKGIVIKTQVTTNLITKICHDNEIEIIDDLLVGFKYIGDVINKIENEGKIDQFLFSAEESHGYLAGNYARDKDASVAAIWLSELAAELKTKDLSLLDYLNQVYSKYGYFRNYLTEIRLPGAEGMGKIQKILKKIRSTPPKNFGRFEVKRIDDWQDRKPIMSETDRQSKNGIVFEFKPVESTSSIRATVRPSGTEPKVKMYFEIGSLPFKIESISSVRKNTEAILKELEKEFMTYCYKLIGVKFPERGFLLFWQLPLMDKLKYFEIEPKVANLKKVGDKNDRETKLKKMLEFLGSDPIQKVDLAFEKKYGESITKYLKL